MIPIAHILARKRLEQKDSTKKKKQLPNRCPHPVHPKVGLYIRDAAPAEEPSQWEGVSGAEPHSSGSGAVKMQCAKAVVAISADERTTTFKITYDYTLPDSLNNNADEAAPASGKRSDGAGTASSEEGGGGPSPAGRVGLFFPVSEFGHVDKLTVHAQGRVLKGQLYRVSRRNGRLVSCANEEEFVNESEEDVDEEGGGVKKDEEKERPKKKQSGPPTVYTFYCPNVLEQVFAGPTSSASAPAVKRPSMKLGGKRLRIELEVAVQTILKEIGVYQVAFPYTAFPKAVPDDVHLSAHMRDSIRRVVALNRTHGVFPYIDGRRADVTLDISPERPLREEDYIFIFQVELGDPIVPQCADPVAILVLVTTLGMMVFYMLTRDLED